MAAQSLLTELRRRNVIRMAGLYLVGAWLLVQVAGTVLPMFGAPDWMPRSVVVLLALGFIPALVFAWVFELTPDGLKRDAEVKPEQSIATQTARRMEHMIVAVLFLAVLYFVFDKFVLAPKRWERLSAATAAPVATPGPVAAEGRSHAPAASANSIAVLPFVDMSQGKDQEYFSDGLSEQLLNELAQIPGLHVAGRTSSFYFKGRNEDLRSIGRKLNVATVLEGSVAKSGNTLRVTAQLIDVANGYHLWSHTYDREFKEVFALQDEIAASVVAALKLKLLPATAATAAASSRSTKPEAYDHYLLGRSVLRQQSMAGWQQAADAFRAAIALDPSYAAAYAGLAEAAYELSYAHADPAAVDAALRQARQYAEKAVALDPTLAEGYRIRAKLNSENAFDQVGAMADIERALELNPGDSDNHAVAGVLLSYVGRFDEAEAALGKALALDPLSVRALSDLGEVHKDRGQWREAELSYRRAIQVAPGASYALSGLSQNYMLQGDYPKALATAKRLVDDPPRHLFNLALAHHSLGQRDESDRALAELSQRYGAGWAYQVGVVHAWRGDSDQAFAWLERAYRQHDGGLAWTRSDGLLHKLHGDPRYAALLKKLGLQP